MEKKFNFQITIVTWECYLTTMVILLMVRKRLIVQSQKALYSVYYKIRNIKIPIDLQLKIFDALAAPILLSGSEVL